MFRNVLACVTLLVAACSSGGDSIPPASSGTLTIVTQSLQQGNVGHAYFVQFQAQGGAQPYTWRVHNGGDPLPAGLALAIGGQLAGTPEAATSSTVVIAVEDAARNIDLVSLSFDVGDVEIAGGSAEAIDPGDSLALAASGGTPSYSFSLQLNMSGATVLADGSYTAGSTNGVDVVRATDADGFYEEISIVVGEDPFVGFDADWGMSDVWWVDWDVVYDPTPVYATDLDEVLVALGLRDPASTGATGTEADQLARVLLIRRALGHLSTYFGNGMDGNPLPGGLSISFAGPAGPTGGSTPGVGGVVTATPFWYGTICVRYGETAGVVGTAWLDDNNVNIEHNCGNPSNTSLGVFANRVLAPYLVSYNNSIASSPVDAADVAGLRAMLLGSPPANPREQAIFAVADGYGSVLAAVLAHEIGHSLGLAHSSPSQGAGDIMNASLSVNPSVAYAFNPGHWGTLQNNLPGPGR